MKHNTSSGESASFRNARLLLAQAVAVDPSVVQKLVRPLQSSVITHRWPAFPPWAGVAGSCILLLTLLRLHFAVASTVSAAVSVNAPTTDVIVVGAGISGLATALDAGRAGASVMVIDLWSVFGGHAVMSGGAVCLVDTPFQHAHHIVDSTDLAIRDFIAHGQDANPDWVRLYARDSRRDVYDWLEEVGVRWSGFNPRMPGNSVQRQHLAKGRGLGLVSPIYQECLTRTNIHFVWNTRVTSLLVESNRIRGARGIDIRSGRTNSFRSQFVVLATGGFESNLELVRQHWPATLPGLEGGAKVLLGSGANSLGSGLEIARSEGAALTNLDHQLFYATGLVDPRDPAAKRGLNSSTPNAIWVNTQGRRFVREMVDGIPDLSGTVPAVLQQSEASYWSIFDSTGRAGFFVSGSGWDNEDTVLREVFTNPRMKDWVKRADSLENLAHEAHLPPEALAQSVHRWNEMIVAGEDTEWQRFKGGTASDRPSPIVTPPFFAVRYFPLARKSMGGVAVDLSCRVLDRSGTPIAGLYAVGELAGVGGINGRAALEGTMLGPGIFMGRIAARDLSTRLKLTGSLPPKPVEQSRSPVRNSTAKASDAEPIRAWREALRQLVQLNRPGYFHFQRVHSQVLDQKLECFRCHSQESPLTLSGDHLDRAELRRSCQICHGTVNE